MKAKQKPIKRTVPVKKRRTGKPRRVSEGPDSGCAPIGSGHHRELHRIGKKDFEAKYGIDLRSIASKLWEAYQKETGKA